MDKILQLAFDNLEYIVGCVGAVGSVGFIMLKKRVKKDNDLTPLIIRYNKQKDAISKRSKIAM